MSSHPLVTFRRKLPSLHQSEIESFAETLQARVAPRRREFHCLITNDAEVRSLNYRFRGKDEATDVLSFPGESPYLGDIAISLQRARLQAREWSHSLEDELRILMLHGMLHLAGMDHETDAGAMARTEGRWRKKLALPSGLIERAKQ